MTQCERILKYLDDFGSITAYQAFKDLGIMRLASRIHDLSERGYDFKRESVENVNRYGEKVHFTRYSLKEVK